MAWDHYRKFVGFYWTFPLPSVGFTSLPEDADAAAEQSRTIRYQRDRVRGHVAGITGGRLVKEVVFLEAAPDRATDTAEHPIRAALELCQKESAQLLHVDFSAVHGSRHHPVLGQWMRLYPVSCLGLDPEPMPIDGSLFDPIAHFRSTKALLHPANARDVRRVGLVGQVRETTDRFGSAATHAQIAEALNAAGIKTLNGRPWTADNLKKFLQTNVDR